VSAADPGQLWILGDDHPPMPSSVVVGPYVYAVVADRALVDRASIEGKEVELGECDHKRQRILIDPDLGPDATAEVLLHEVLHALTYATDLDRDLGENEEPTVARLAFAMLDLLRRNPQLVTFLVGPPPAPARGRPRRSPGT
jgi:hypothetical protein